jgi:hypothetical protein
MLFGHIDSAMSWRLTAKKALRMPAVWFRQRGLTSNDVLIASYPRSGSTWLRFMLYEVLTGQPSGFTAVNQAIPAVGQRVRALLPEGGRLLQTHELRSKLGPRVIYMVRDVRDVLLSEHRARRRVGAQPPPLDTFVRTFLNGRVDVFGSWVEHVSYWVSPNEPSHPHLFLLRYEDLRADTEARLTEVLQFLNVASSSAIIREAIEDNSLARMREKEASAFPNASVTVDPEARFVGKGLVEGWRGHLSAEAIRAIEAAAGSVLSQLGYPTR